MATEELVVFDIHTLEQVNSPNTDLGTVQHTVQEIPSLENFQNGESDSDSLYEDNDDVYEISTDSENDELPMYPITNIRMTTVEGDEENGVVIDIDDELSNWIYEQSDGGPSCGPFLSNSYCTVHNPDKKPELYFEALFDERMWTIISDATNLYTLSKRTTPDGNMCRDPTHPQYRKHQRLNTWTDTSPSEIKLFMAHILIMGLVNKSELEKYWNMNSCTKIPFFGKYMSRNRFQALLWNIHVNDDSQNPPRNQPGHDPLCKIRPFVDMVQRNFLYAYKPSKRLSFDEACCPFKGRVKFRVYNPMKPNRFHIKLFQVSESLSGYILGFHVYTGKDSSDISNFSRPLDKDCTKTTKTVLGLLEQTKLLDKGHHIYMDNYYSSPELFDELYYRQTYACGTARQMRKGMPQTLRKCKLKPLESAFMRNGPLLCLKWVGQKMKSKKKPVTILTTIHEANELLTKKKDSHGNRIPKPVCISEYTKNMSGVDISDQYMAYHVALRKSMKWSRKLLFHLFNMIILNSYLLNQKFGKKMAKQDFIEYIATYLVEMSIGHVSLPGRSTFSNDSNSRLVERHFPQKIGYGKNGLLCRACNFSPTQLTKLGLGGVKLKRKTTSYCCAQCDVPLCVTPCFEIYHKFQDYGKETLRNRLPIL